MAEPNALENLTKRVVELEKQQKALVEGAADVASNTRVDKIETKLTDETNKLTKNIVSLEKNNNEIVETVDAANQEVVKLKKNLQDFSKTKLTFSKEPTKATIWNINMVGEDLFFVNPSNGITLRATKENALEHQVHLSSATIKRFPELNFLNEEAKD